MCFHVYFSRVYFFWHLLVILPHSAYYVLCFKLNVREV
jgi:hypothetical protein